MIHDPAPRPFQGRQDNRMPPIKEPTVGVWRCNECGNHNLSDSVKVCALCRAKRDGETPEPAFLYEGPCVTMDEGHAKGGAS